MYREYLEKLYQKQAERIVLEQRPFDREKTDAEGEKLFTTVISRDVEWFNKSDFNFKQLKFPIKKQQADSIQQKFSQIAEDVQKDVNDFIAKHKQIFTDEKTKKNFANTVIISYLFNLTPYIDGYKEISIRDDVKSKGAKDFYRVMAMNYQPELNGKALDTYYFYYTKGDGAIKTNAQTFLETVIQASDRKAFAKKYAGVEKLDTIMEANIRTRPRGMVVTEGSVFQPAGQEKEEEQVEDTTPRFRR